LLAIWGGLLRELFGGLRVGIAWLACSASASTSFNQVIATDLGDRLRHAAFGEGCVTHLFGSGEPISLAVKFEGMGPEILDPRLAPIEPL